VVLKIIHISQVKIQNYAQENPHRSTMQCILRLFLQGLLGSSLFHFASAPPLDSGSLRLLYCSLNFLAAIGSAYACNTHLPQGHGSALIFSQEISFKSGRDFDGYLNPKSFERTVSYGLIQSNKPVQTKTD